MSTMVSFTKMQGLGNDFVVVGAEVEVTPALVVSLCDRHFGVGGDGLLRVSRGEDAVTMEYWNSDGSAAEMCGNGLRCVARYAVERGLESGEVFDVVTPAGRRPVRIGPDRVSVDVGPAEVGRAVEIGGREYITVRVGNPHAVTWVDDPTTVDVAGIGGVVARDPEFPEGTNVEFIHRAGPDRLEMRVWERGVGETLACGSGMVAAAAVARREGVRGEIEVSVPGGVGSVLFEGIRSWLSGPAELVFEGTWISERA